MKHAKQNLLLFAMLMMGMFAHAVALAAPGEDPIALSDPVQYLALPTSKPAVSGALDPAPGLPAWSRARINRYQAKAFSDTANDGTIYTDSDVITTVKTNGFQTTCVQEVGSVTGEVPLGSKYGPNKREQVVVLRGDLINVCK